MPTTYRPYSPAQQLLLPTSLEEWLPEDHLSYFIADTVDSLDLSSFYERYDGDGRRRQPFEPSMMVKVLVYAYASGVFSSRKIAKKLEEDVAFRVLAANNFPAHRTIREFRQRHLPEFSRLFLEVVRLAQEIGLIKLGRLGVDGTKIRANASKHKAMSYGRMKDEEKRLQAEITDLLKQAEEADQLEDERYGTDSSGDELPEELRRRESRLKAIQAAKARLEARQCQADEESGRWKDDDGNTRGPKGRRCKRELGVPEDKAQDNFTDPQSRIMKTQEGFQQCYNAQAAVDEDNQIIVAADLTNCAADNGELLPLLDQVETNMKEQPKVVLADTGYGSEETFQKLEERNLAAYISLGRENKQQREADPEEYPATSRMAERLASEEGKAHYRRRKAIPEPVFGWIKQAMGFRQFTLRGLESVKGEWQLVCLATNLRRMHRLAQVS
ncbi:MAG: IS1182 family transposase [Gammaproteobacteria bacterium]|nr:IS1182 family transposase [Gammaproteobacteria bacterium]